MRISAYNKEYGDMFYIPTGIKEYLKEREHGKKWKQILKEIMLKVIKKRIEIYQERCKEHSKRLKTKQLKKEWIDGKNIAIPRDPLEFMPKRVKYNEIIDLTEEFPSIIIDLNMKRNRTKRKSSEIGNENINNKKKRSKKVNPIVITGLIPRKKTRNKQ
jgi:hypothetical protein